MLPYAAVFHFSSLARNAFKKFPESNFTSVIPAMLNSDTFDHLIVQAGSVDITNLKTKVQPTKYFRQETVISAKNLFSACEYCQNCRQLVNTVKTVDSWRKFSKFLTDGTSCESYRQMINSELTLI